jgi:hypothetical protein
MTTALQSFLIQSDSFSVVSPGTASIIIVLPTPFLTAAHTSKDSAAREPVMQAAAALMMHELQH